MEVSGYDSILVALAPCIALRDRRRSAIGVVADECVFCSHFVQVWSRFHVVVPRKISQLEITVLALAWQGRVGVALGQVDRDIHP
jgi:hypothetical protein